MVQKRKARPPKVKKPVPYKITLEKDEVEKIKSLGFAVSDFIRFSVSYTLNSVFKAKIEAENRSNT